LDRAQQEPQRELPGEGEGDRACEPKGGGEGSGGGGADGRVHREARGGGGGGMRVVFVLDYRFSLIPGIFILHFNFPRVAGGNLL